MANNRPKSLNELGNLYDKSLEAEKEIQKSASKLEDKPVNTDSAFLPEESSLPMKKTPQQIASDEIAEKVGAFAKSFGSQSDGGKNPITIATVQSKPRAPKKKLEPDSQQEAKAKKAAEPLKSRLIRDPERTSLFDNYKKVMDDEDDDLYAEPEKPEKKKLRPRRKSALKSQKAVDEENPVKEPENEIDLQAEAAVDAVFDKKEPEKEAEKSEEKAPFKKISYEEYVGTSTEAAATEEAPEVTSVKKAGTQITLMILLLCVLLSAIGIGSIKAFSGIDRDKPVFGKYYVCTVKRDYTASGIKKGDLVISENKAPVAGDVIAYRKGTAAYAFAKYEAALNAESMIANNSNEQVLVFNSEARGVVVRILSGVGVPASAIISYFLPIMGLMLFLAALLILLLFFVSKRNDAEDDEEEEEEESDDNSSEDSAEDESVEDEIETLFKM